MTLGAAGLGVYGIDKDVPVEDVPANVQAKFAQAMGADIDCEHQERTLGYGLASGGDWEFHDCQTPNGAFQVLITDNLVVFYAPFKPGVGFDIVIEQAEQYIETGDSTIAIT